VNGLDDHFEAMEPTSKMSLDRLVKAEADYLAARRLVQNLLLEGLTLSATAVEKYFKAILSLAKRRDISQL
jgi:hypothetical protein